MALLGNILKARLSDFTFSTVVIEEDKRFSGAANVLLKATFDNFQGAKVYISGGESVQEPFSEEVVVFIESVELFMLLNPAFDLIRILCQRRGKSGCVLAMNSSISSDKLAQALKSVATIYVDINSFSSDHSGHARCTHRRGVLKYTEEIAAFSFTEKGVQTSRYKGPITTTEDPNAGALGFNAFATGEAALPYREFEAAVIQHESDDEDGDEDYECLARNF